MLIYVLLLENCQKSICMHGYSPIHVERSLRVSNLGENLSHTFKKKKDLSTWIGDQACMQMDLRQFSRNNMYVSIPGKLSEIYLHAWLFSNPCGKMLIFVGISWSPDLRAQRICCSSILKWLKKLTKSCPGFFLLVFFMIYKEEAKA